eukprot:jgi/Mesvir1/16089/Mv08383-RA.1
MAPRWVVTLATWATAFAAALWALYYVMSRAAEGLARLLCVLTLRGASDECVERMRRKIEALSRHLDAILGVLVSGFIALKGFKFLRRGETRAGLSSETDRVPEPANDARERRPEGREMPRFRDMIRHGI